MEPTHAIAVDLARVFADPGGRSYLRTLAMALDTLDRTSASSVTLAQAPVQPPAGPTAQPVRAPASPAGDPAVDQATQTVKDKLDQSGSGLSGGQQQRLCIARGIAIRPDVLLLDEPCSALDPISTGKIEELIIELKKDYTVVIVTHNMQQAARVSDYTAYMYLGDLVEVGETEQIFFKPKRQETEDYITGRFG